MSHVRRYIFSNHFALKNKPTESVYQELQNKLLLTNGCYNPLNNIISNTLDALIAFLYLHLSTYKKPDMSSGFNINIK